MASNLGFYKTSREGSIALTQLARDNPKARLLIDWLSMILVNRNSTANVVMVSNTVLQEVLGCSVNTVTKAIKAANKAGVLGVNKIGGNQAYYLNPKAIKMSRIDDNNYAFDVAVVLDKNDKIYESITMHEQCRTFGLSKNGSGETDGKKGEKRKNGGVVK